MLTITEALSLLTPYDVDQRKERIGPVKDGGYVLLPDLFDGRPVFSYGISTEYQFDIDMASRGHQIYMFDHTIEGISNPTQDPKLHWVKQGVGGSSDPETQLETLDNHIAAYAPAGDNLILKMDVEGYEYEAFESISEKNLKRFQQIVFEIHNLHSLHLPEFRNRFIKVLSKINRYFTLFHVHANNFDGTNTYTFMEGIPISNLLELSFVRSDLVTRRPSQTLYPTPLDYPCVHPHDKKLWFFPFLPTSVKPEEFAAANQRMEMVAELKMLRG
jgi:hypothetical protein